MEKIELEVYGQGSNIAVVRLPGRSFPGVVIQGDSLSILYEAAASIVERVSTSDDEELQGDANELKELLASRLKFYEATLQAHGMALPYIRPKLNLHKD